MNKEAFRVQREIGSTIYEDWAKVDRRTLINFDCKARVLPDYAEKVPENGVIVEIGSYMGASMAVLGLSSKNSVKVYCVELNVLPELTSNIKKYGLSDRVIVLPGSSVGVAKEWHLPIDLLFIDADHGYDSAMMDSEAWTPFLKENGVVAWHDYGYPLFDCPNVKPAVDDFMKEHAEFEEVHVEPYIYVARKRS